MKNSIASWLQNHSRVSLLAGLLFVAGLLFSVFQLVVLPGRLSLAGLPDAQVSQLVTPLWVSIGLALLLGATSLYLLVSSKKEVIVYLERKRETESQKTNGREQTADVASVLKSLEAEKTDPAGSSLSAICQWLQAGQGAYYEVNHAQGQVQLAHAFAFAPDGNHATTFQLGEGLVGQAAASGQPVYLDEIPEGYVRIISGLGSASPRYVYLFCLKKGNTVLGVYEIATFAPVTPQQKQDLEKIAAWVAGRL
jgi:methyl-accepting chemotaxis protein